MRGNPLLAQEEFSLKKKYAHSRARTLYLCSSSLSLAHAYGVDGMTTPCSRTRVETSPSTRSASSTTRRAMTSIVSSSTNTCDRLLLRLACCLSQTRPRTSRTRTTIPAYTQPCCSMYPEQPQLEITRPSIVLHRHLVSFLSSLPATRIALSSSLSLSLSHTLAHSNQPPRREDGKQETRWRRR